VTSILSILEGIKTSCGNKISKKLTTDDMAHMKFTPMTSVDVEQTFSKYKTTLADNYFTL